MIQVQVIIDDTVGDVREMAERLRQPGPLMKVLARLLEDHEREAFATSGHGQWAPADPVTQELKRSGRTLVDTGNLLRELTSARVEGESVVVDSGDAYYAKFLRDGSRGMPKRDPAPEPSVAQVDQWADALLGFIVEGRT